MKGHHRGPPEDSCCDRAGDGLGVALIQVKKVPDGAIPPQCTYSLEGQRCVAELRANAQCPRFKVARIALDGGATWRSNVRGVTSGG